MWSLAVELLLHGLGGRVQQVVAVCLVGRGQAMRGGGKALALPG